MAVHKAENDVMCGGSPLIFYCRGEYTGEIIFDTLVLPSLNRFLCFLWFCFRLNLDVGENTQGRDKVYSRSPLSEPLRLVLFMMFTVYISVGEIHRRGV